MATAARYVRFVMNAQNELKLEQLKATGISTITLIRDARNEILALRDILDKSPHYLPGAFEKVGALKWICNEIEKINFENCDES